MAVKYVELVLDFRRHWQKDRRCWRLESYFRDRIESVTLRIDGKEIPSAKYKLNSGNLELIDETIEVASRPLIFSRLALF